MTSSSILYTFYFAIVAWLYSSIGVLFLSDSVPEHVDDKVYVIYIDVRDISHV